MKQFSTKILKNSQISSDFYEISFSWGADETPRPGQFLTVRVSDTTVPLLRRPFAISSYRAESSIASVSFIYQKRGIATDLLSGKREGEQIDVLGPLGKPFIIEGVERALIVAGGIGLGPMLFLFDTVRKKNALSTFIFGCRSKSFIPSSAEFDKAEPVICTDDGSAGFKGTVADYMTTLSITPGTVLYACGPTPMLKACHRFAQSKGIEAWVSVEQVMACGVGACMGCVVKTVEGYARACKEGPVFRSDFIDWEA